MEEMMKLLMKLPSKMIMDYIITTVISAQSITAMTVMVQIFHVAIIAKGTTARIVLRFMSVGNVTILLVSIAPKNVTTATKPFVQNVLRMIAYIFAPIVADHTVWTATIKGIMRILFASVSSAANMAVILVDCVCIKKGVSIALIA